MGNGNVRMLTWLTCMHQQIFTHSSVQRQTTMYHSLLICHFISKINRIKRCYTFVKSYQLKTNVEITQIKIKIIKYC